DLEKGYRARGKDAADALVLIQDAKRMEDAGAVMILLEAVASEVAREITSNTKIPVIGCASGPHCDGTVVVLHDMIGWGGGHPPKSVKRYQNLAEILSKVFAQYTEDIHTGRFPNEDDAIHMKPGEYEKLLAHIGES
ncbi:MAG: 3-methyl-2-oxobutanoate hydroxymethyltransferase, partial [Planctomycetota bacterium]